MEISQREQVCCLLSAVCWPLRLSQVDREKERASKAMALRRLTLAWSRGLAWSTTTPLPPALARNAARASSPPSPSLSHFPSGALTQLPDFATTTTATRTIGFTSGVRSRRDLYVDNGRSDFSSISSFSSDASLRATRRGVTSQTAAEDSFVESEFLRPEGEVFENYVPVNAYYLNSDIHLERLTTESALFGSLERTARNDHLAINITPLCKPVKQSLVTFTARKQGIGDTEGQQDEMRGEGEESGPESTYCTLVTNYQNSFLVAFRYGSVVFFNVADDLVRDRYLKEIGRCALSSFQTSKSEDYSIIVDPRQRQWSQLSLDHLKLRCLDMNNIVVISSVLGQSVALDHYHTKVDLMLKDFSRINQEMEQTGNFNMPRKKLFQLVAQNNTTYSDSITKIKLLEKPSEAAWEYAHYGAIWDQLRSEFEVEERFQRLSLKMELMQNNVKYFLEILQNRKSDTLEWIIIILIAGEIILCLYDIYDRRQEKNRLKEEKRKERERENQGLQLQH